MKLKWITVILALSLLTQTNSFSVPMKADTLDEAESADARDSDLDSSPSKIPVPRSLHPLAKLQRVQSQETIPGRGSAAQKPIPLNKPVSLRAPNHAPMSIRPQHHIAMPPKVRSPGRNSVPLRTSAHAALPARLPLRTPTHLNSPVRPQFLRAPQKIPSRSSHVAQAVEETREKVERHNSDTAEEVVKAPVLENLLHRQEWAEAFEQRPGSSGSGGDKDAVDVIHNLAVGHHGMTAIKDTSLKACFINHFFRPAVIPQPQRVFYTGTMPATVVNTEDDEDRLRSFVGSEIASLCLDLKTYWLDPELFFKFTNPRDLRSRHSQSLMHSTEEERQPYPVPQKTNLEPSNLGSKFPVPVKRISETLEELAAPIQLPLHAIKLKDAQPKPVEKPTST